MFFIRLLTFLIGMPFIFLAHIFITLIMVVDFFFDKRNVKFGKTPIPSWIKRCFREE